MAFPISRLGRYELRRFRGLMPKVALVFVLIVPLLYGAIYLTANWDPYGRTQHLPVALVNADRPVTVNGRTLDAGADLAANLHAAHTFAWTDTDAATASRGLAEGTYYLVLSIPADFSANLVSGAGDDPQRAGIELRRNDANGFVVGSLTNSAQNSIARAVDASAQESYFNAVYANLATIRTSLTKARGGAGELADGARDAHTGSRKLLSGSADALAGAQTLSTGAGSLHSGLDTAATGATDLATGLGRLRTGSADLSSGAAKVAAGTQRLDDAVVPPLTELSRTLPDVERQAKSASATLTTVTTQAAGATGSVADDLDHASSDLKALVKAHPELANDAAFGRLQSRLSRASDRAGTVAAQAQRAASTVSDINHTVQGTGDLAGRVTKARDDVVALNTGAHQVASGAKTLHRSLRTATRGADTLAAGVTKADRGAAQLDTGSRTLRDGLSTLHDGAGSLDSGLATLATGAGTLHTRLAEGVARIPTVTPEQQADAVQVLSSPADVRTVIDNPATTYGRGLAPLFLAIAVWVFGISVFLVVRPISGRALAGRAHPVRLALAAWAPVGAIAVAAGWLMVGVVWGLLGLDPVHPGWFLLAVTLGSMCFSAIAHLLRVALGTAGSSLLLVMLILQLCASGGTYPGPLLPAFFARIGPFLPLTYLINAYRVTISGGLLSHYGRDVAVLAGVLVAILTLTVLTVRRRQQFSLADLHPPLTAP